MSAVRTRRSTTAAPEQARRPGAWLVALVMPVGPAAVALLRFVLPYDTVDDTATMVAKVAADPSAQSLVLWLGLLGILTLVPGAVWVGRLTVGRARRTTAVALTLLVPGYLALAWIMAHDIILLAGSVAEVEPAVVVSLLDATHATVELAALVFVVGHVLGTILLGVAMWISRAVPRWAAALTAVSQPLHVVAAVVVVSHTLDLAAWGMQAVAFGAAGAAMARLLGRGPTIAATTPH